ncbi:hypothetical protein Tco_0618689 [Tanacetum coccineum]
MLQCNTSQLDMEGFIQSYILFITRKFINLSRLSLLYAGYGRIHSNLNKLGLVLKDMVLELSAFDWATVASFLESHIRFLIATIGMKPGDSQLFATLAATVSHVLLFHGSGTKCNHGADHRVYVSGATTSQCGVQKLWRMDTCHMPALGLRQILSSDGILSGPVLQLTCRVYISTPIRCIEIVGLMLYMY